MFNIADADDIADPGQPQQHIPRRNGARNVPGGIEVGLDPGTGAFGAPRPAYFNETVPIGPFVPGPVEQRDRMARGFHDIIHERPGRYAPVIPRPHVSRLDIPPNPHIDYVAVNGAPAPARMVASQAVDGLAEQRAAAEAAEVQMRAMRMTAQLQAEALRQNAQAQLAPQVAEAADRMNEQHRKNVYRELIGGMV